MILPPLNDLLCGVGPKSSCLHVKSNKDAETAFINIKTDVTNSVMLGFPSKSDIYHQYTDASDKCLDAFLTATNPQTNKQ